MKTLPELKVSDLQREYKSSLVDIWEELTDATLGKRDRDI
jgi:hypothetical protein